MGRFFSKESHFINRDQVDSILIKEGAELQSLYTFGVPTYKRACDLKETLDSIIGQETDIPFQIIVVDNNPERNDETEQLIKQEFKKNINLSYYKNCENLGMAGNWNRLIQLTKTKYLIMVHDDDVLFPYFLDEIHYYVQKRPSVSALNCKKINSASMPSSIEAIKIPHHKKHLIKHSVYTNLLSYSFGPPTGCLFNVLDVMSIGGFDSNAYPSIDYELILRLGLMNKEIYSTVTPLMYYRIVGNATEKEETHLKWVELEYELKEELMSLLKIKPLFCQVVQKYNIKMRLRDIEQRFDKCIVYKRMKPGGYSFLVFYNILSFFNFLNIQLFNRVIV